MWHLSARWMQFDVLKENETVNNNAFKSEDLMEENFVQIGQGISGILAFEIFGTK